MASSRFSSMCSPPFSHSPKVPASMRASARRTSFSVSEAFSAHAPAPRALRLVAGVARVGHAVATDGAHVLPLPVDDAAASSIRSAAGSCSVRCHGAPPGGGRRVRRHCFASLRPCHLNAAPCPIRSRASFEGRPLPVNQLAALQRESLEGSRRTEDALSRIPAETPRDHT